MSEDGNLATALSYVERGWTLIPCNVTYDSGGHKRPDFFGRFWGRDASNDYDVVRDWYVQRPWAGMAIATKPSKLVGIDLDLSPEANGLEEWLRLCGEHGADEIPATFTVKTPRGGLHLYFQDLEGRAINSVKRLAPGIDVRGSGDLGGGLLFAPPTKTNWGPYAIELDVETVPLPEWVWPLIEKPETVAFTGTGDSLFDTPESSGTWTRAQFEAETIRMAQRVLACKNNGEGSGFNTEINNAGLRLGRFVAGGFLTGTEAYALLDQWCRDCWGSGLNGPNGRTATGSIRDGMTKHTPFVLVPDVVAVHTAGDPGDVRPPELVFTDSGIAQHAIDHAFDGEFAYAHGLGWLRYESTRWVRVDEGIPGERVRRLATARLAELVLAGKMGSPEFKGWTKYNNAGAIGAVTRLCASMDGVRREADAFDADPDVLNTPGGVVHLPTGEIRPHSPGLLLTKITSGHYKPGYTHADWETALEALPEPERSWLQVRCGQGVTGHPTDDGVVALLYGPNGQNGKGALLTGGILPAFKDYAAPCSTKLFEAGNSHSTEMADLRGQRLMMAEELTDGAVLNTDAIKRISDVEEIKARYVRQDNIRFATSHSLFMSSNYRPRVKADDGGTWRRLALVVFPYEYVKPGVALSAPYHRRGDLGLKPRIKAGLSGQHDAVVTWAIEGARRWYAWRAESEACARAGRELPAAPGALTARIEEDTAAWRAENDHVQGYWNERLVLDAERCIERGDMLDDVNNWLAENGYAARYSKEAWGRKFGSHAITRERGVVTARIRDKSGIDRPIAPATGSEGGIFYVGASKLSARRELPVLPHVWKGVRFRTNVDE